MAVMSLSKMIGRLSIKGDHYSLTIQLFFSNPVFVHMKAQFKYCGQEEEAKYWHCTLTTCMVLLCQEGGSDPPWLVWGLRQLHFQRWHPLGRCVGWCVLLRSRSTVRGRQEHHSSAGMQGRGHVCRRLATPESRSGEKPLFRPRDWQKADRRRRKTVRKAAWYRPADGIGFYPP